MTKDGSLCGILLTSFHDETILIKQEYTNIFNVLSLLKVVPTQNEAHVTGNIYTHILNTTFKLCDDYFGNISYVFEKLDSFIRIEISQYKLNGREQKITSIEPFQPLEHWMKMVHIFKCMSEFLVNNNISTNLPIKNTSQQCGETLEDLCIHVTKCMMYVLYKLCSYRDPVPSVIITECHSVLQNLFSFSPYIAIKTFPQFKKFIIHAHNENYQAFCCQQKDYPETAENLYGKVFGAILNIHFKLSKEVPFLETLFRSEDLTLGVFVTNNASWLPEASYRSALHQIVSSVSCERILSGWLNCIVAHFNVKSMLKESAENLYYYIYSVCTSLVCTLEVTLVQVTASLRNDSLVSAKQTQLLNDVKQHLCEMKVLLDTRKKNPQLYLSFLQVCTHWGAFKIMMNEYDIRAFDIDNIKLTAMDPCLHVLHNYLEAKDWKKICDTITSNHRSNVPVMNALSELFAQCLEMLYLFDNIDNFTISPQESTARFLVDNSDSSWLLRRAHLIEPYLSIEYRWKLAERLSNYLVATENWHTELENNVALHELNVLVFGIALHVLHKAVETVHSEASDILNHFNDEVLELATHEDKDQFNKIIKMEENMSTTKPLEPSSDDSDVEGSNSEESDEKSEKKRKSTKNVKEESEDSDTAEPNTVVKKRKVNEKDEQGITCLIECIDSPDCYEEDTDIPSIVSKYISIIEALPVQHLHPSSQHLLFTLVLICTSNSIKTESLISGFLLGNHFTLPNSRILPLLIGWIQISVGTKYKHEVLTKVCKLSVQRESAIKMIAKYCELTKKNTEDIDVEKLSEQSLLSYYFLNELNTYKTSNKTIKLLKKKIISRTYKNFKSLKLKPTQDLLLLFGFMLQKSLKEHDSQSIQMLCSNLNSYLDLALEHEHRSLIELVLTYADLTLKKYIPPDFTPRVWNTLPSCANLCFQSATLEQFNQFLEQMYKQMEDLLESSNTKTCDLRAIEVNFELWRKLMTSHLSRNTNIARLGKLENVIACLSTYVSLYDGDTTEHFPMIFQLVLDIVYSSTFTCVNTSIVHYLFNLMTPKSCVHFKYCIKLLQYLITKKASIISDETALFLLKYHCILSQVARYVCYEECSDGDVLLIAMGKVAHAIRKEKKYFQRVAPYILSNIMQLYQVHKFPLGVTVHMNEISNIFISICDEHGIHFLKHSLPDSCKQLFLQILQNYTKYSSHRFV